MLALTRKIGEQLMIGNNITLTVVDIRGDSVKLAIDAPKEVRIYRGEIYAAIVKENRESAIPSNIKDIDFLK